MKNRLDKIAEEYSEIFDRMGWQWDTSTFKGIPNKERIMKDIVDKIMELKKLSYDCDMSSGRIVVSKKLLQDEYHEYWQYRISLKDYSIDEDELDDLLEFNGNDEQN